MLVAEKTATAARLLVNNGAWNAQLHLRTRSDFAPHLELRADLLGALAHAWHTPVSVPSCVQVLRINPFSIVPDTQPKKTVAVCDVRFDLTCLRVAERILQRLTRNSVNVVAKNWAEVPRRAFYRNAERRRTGLPIVGAGELLTQRGHSVGQFVGNRRRGTYVLNCVAALYEGPIGPIENLFESVLSFAGRKQIVYRLEMDHQRLKALQQRVVQFPGDARTFIDTRFHARVKSLRDLMEAVPVQPPEHQEEGGCACRLEPSGLIIRRADGKIEGRAGLVPHSAVIAGGDAKAVIAWRKIVIERLPFIANVLPVGIAAFQLDAKTDLLRRHQAESGVVDLEIANKRGQAQVRRGLVGLAVGGDLLDVYRRRKLVDGNVTWIDDVDAVEWQEPQFSIGGLGDARSVFAYRDCTEADAVGTIECGALNDPLRIGRPRIYLGPG